MKLKSIFLAGAALALAAGCNLAPSYQAPTTAAADKFKEAMPDAAETMPGWKPADPRDSALRGPWWEMYRDPDLDALEARVAVSNQTVAAAEANYRAARALADEARAGWFPTVNLVPSFSRSRASAAAGSTSPAAGTTASSGASTPSGSAGGTQATRNLYTLPLEASYQVDLWGRVRNQVAQNAAAAQASAADVATALLSTQAQLADDYFELRAVDEQRRILDTTLADYEASFHLVDTLFKNGLASDEDRAAAEAQLGAAEAAATDLGITRAQYEHAIAVLIGVAPAQFSLHPAPFNPALPTVPVGLPADLLERRPDVAAAERNAAAANAGIGIARAAYFPTLSLSASAGYEANRLSKLFDWPNSFWSVGPSLAQALFDGGARRAATAQARALFDQAAADYRQAVLSALQATEDNLASLRILAAEEKQQHRAALAAQNQVRLSVARYKLGIDSYVNVITAQDSFLSNRQAELEVQVRRLIASINLINNLGGGWDASQLGETEKMAKQPPGAGQPAQVPADEAGPGVPNPPPEKLGPPRPEELLQQDEAALGP
jgi:NodT family efflux transporter outer membrane factor (OMF) lipoprotein